MVTLMEDRAYFEHPFLAAMLHSALDCVVAIDARGRIIAWNRAAEKTFGRSAKSVIGKDMGETIVPADLREAHRAGLHRVLSGGAGRLLDQRIELVGMRADGWEFPVELTITQIEMPGAPIFVGYLRDISERAVAEAELRASRARIVRAGDEARRRIERDLHDGAQQRLVALALTLRIAREQAAAGEDVTELIDEVIADLASTTAELRELARGMFPAVLAEGGLDPALGTLVRRSTVPTTLEGAVGRRLTPAIEASAYFVVAEALTNVAKYAQATSAVVRVIPGDGTLAIEVADDGIGGADPSGGTGLSGLADRAAALDGTLAVTTGPEGTKIRLELPCGS
jgi:PAS domain S-box-containing protein